VKAIVSINPVLYDATINGFFILFSTNSVELTTTVAYYSIIVEVSRDVNFLSTIG
jgi:hypothetical protein